MVFVVTSVSASAITAKSSVFTYLIPFIYSMALLPFTFYVTMLSFSEGITKAPRQRRRLRKEEEEENNP